MLVNAADMLKKAEAGKYGLGAFNTNNLEWTLAILQAAEEAKSPLILQCTAGAAKWMGGFKVCADMVKAAVEATGVTVPVALHLDHGSYEDCFKCIEAGFTSIMYDGSHEETFQLNLDRTKELVELAHSKGMSFFTFFWLFSKIFWRQTWKKMLYYFTPFYSSYTTLLSSPATSSERFSLAGANTTTNCF